jgi:mRNA-degrading endonuclease RelE of RelBE toxin-antitoxin system
LKLAFFGWSPAAGQNPGGRLKSLTHVKLEIGVDLPVPKVVRRVKPLSGEFGGSLRLRVGNHSVLFDETEGIITVHRVGGRTQADR